MSRWQAYLNPRSMAVRLTLVCIVATIANGIVARWDPMLLPLVPQLVVSDQRLWQLVSWVFVGEPSALTVLLGGLMLILFGRELEASWGTRRVVLTLFGTTLAAAVIVVLASLVFPLLTRVRYFGLWPLVTVMWVAQGLILKHRLISFWGLQVTGYVYAAIGASFTVLNAIFGSFLAHLPDLLVIGFTALVVYGYSPAALWTRFRGWQLSRDLKKRSAKLKVLSGERRNMPDDSDKYLH